MSELTLAQAGTRALESYIAAGDIGRLDPTQRIALYRAVCDSLGLNPLTQPFEYLSLNGKVQLYAKKSCTEQLRAIHGVSVTRMEREVQGDIVTVTVAVRDRTGREDISTGSVALGALRGEALANAHMKAETKAKRRATLSICGLAVLDETEIDSIPNAKSLSVEDFHAAPAKSEPKQMKEMTREERREDLEQLMSPVPPGQKDAKTDTMVISHQSQIGVVDVKGKRVWRVDQDGEPLPIAVLDERIASVLEAQQAFRVDTVVRVRTRKNGGLEIVELIGDAK